jgi:hypothetical protein
MPVSGPDGKENGGNKEATDNYQRLVKQSNLYNSTEIELINFLRDCYRRSHPLLGGGVFVDGGALVFNGANVRLCADDGAFYRLWRNKSGLKIGMRTGPLSGSSHASDEPQYEIQLDQAGVFLVGACSKFPNVPGGRHTWFQSEAHAGAGTWLQTIGHTASYGAHVSSGYQQVGSFGYSEYSEKEVASGWVMSGRKANPLLCENRGPYLF